MTLTTSVANDVEQANQYIAIAEALMQLGVNIAGKFGGIVKLFHPDAALTEDQINAIEQAAIADDKARQAASEVMALPS